MGEKTRSLITRVYKIKIIQVQSEIESLLLESNLIKKYKPVYNIKLIDGKSYPVIKITIKDDYPLVSITRFSSGNRFDDESLYFGPYPSSSSLYLVFKMIRKIFPFQSDPNHPKKPCFYYHLGYCPCPTVFDSQETKRSYKKTIKHIIDFLNGEIKNVVSDLEKERDLLSKSEQYERAGKTQYKIDSINLITTPVKKPFEYEENPNLIYDLRKNELDKLKEILSRKGVSIDELRRIECYDISNISGNFATGSMVVFIDGEKTNSLYRRFKIKHTKPKPNDFSMMEEVIKRRLRHQEWSLPDLLIVDGGKGQVSKARKAIEEKNYRIPVIGLAKKRETIVTSDFKEINLPGDNEALHLLQRIRDEAHRFAITYHRRLRSKYFLI